MNRFLLLLAFSGFVWINSYSQTPAVHYHFNATFRDTGSNKIDGTAFGNPVFTADKLGRTNKALEFDGVDDYVNLGSSSILKPAYQLTLTIWANNSNWSAISNNPTLVGNTEDGGYGIMINSTTKKLEARAYRKNIWGVASYALSNLSSGWHQFGLIYTNGITSLYVDGNLVDTNMAVGNQQIQYSLTAINTIIGDEASSTSIPEGKRFKGTLDDVRFYLVSLNDPQMKALYSTTASVVTQNAAATKVYPNPIENLIHMQSENFVGKDIEITFHNIAGVKMTTVQVFSANKDITIERPTSIPSGCYFVTIKNNEGLHSIQKVVFE